MPATPCTQVDMLADTCRPALSFCRAQLGERDIESSCLFGQPRGGVDEHALVLVPIVD
jgi:hypothetical protein